MLKKGLGTLITASALSLLISGAASADGSLDQSQTGPADVRFGEKFINGSSLTGFQFQGARTTSPATFTQEVESNLSVSDGSQSTTVSAGASQSVSTEEPSQTAQSQVDQTTAVQVEKSFLGGPTIQHQAVQRTSFNYQLSIKSIAPYRR